MNSKAPLVSIIVPMYNVGTFARPCVKSLLVQTYENVEILIVNDGSTDKTVEVIRETAGADSRIKILNKENGGLSSARNYGSERCAGDYVMYVDGDDLIAPNAVELMVGAAREYDVEFVAASFAKVPPIDSYELDEDAAFAVESGRERLRRLLLLDGESGSACGKLYARSLVPLLKYPEGQLFEDMGVTAAIYSRVDRVAVTDAPLCAYVTRPNSITTLRGQGPNHAADMDRAVAQVHETLGGEMEEEFECFRSYCTLRVAMRLDLGSFGNREAGLAYVRRAREFAKATSRSPLASRTWRLRCALFAFSPAVHNAFYAIYGRLSGKVIG